MMVNPEKLMHLNVKYKKRISSEMRFLLFSNISRGTSFRQLPQI